MWLFNLQVIENDMVAARQEDRNLSADDFSRSYIIPHFEGTVAVAVSFYFCDTEF